MRTGTLTSHKIVTLTEAKKQMEDWKQSGKTIAFTNGCFDIIHSGHIASLEAAATLADKLVVGLNADVSVKGLKGDGRPVNDEQSRATVIAALAMVDAVVLFSEPTPIELIKTLLPDFLVKGGDYKVEDIAGAQEVIANGGKVVINPILKGFSTTSIINKLKQASKG